MPLIVSAGRDVPWKGFATLREVVSEIPDTQLFIANSLPHDELITKIKQADVFVLNTGYEGFSHLLLEVMAAGTPIITTRVGGNLEIVEDGVNGVLVEYNNKQQLKSAIADLLSNPDKARALAQNAKQTVQKFTTERMINELVQELET